MSTPSALITAVSVLDSLVRAGMKHVVVSPGSRSAPLAYALAALAEAGVVTSHVRVDERSAGFTALGLALAHGSPVGIIVTSGTAVGNLLPAVMEAYHSGAPLVVLSADRPLHLRGSGANQTTHQAGILASHCRASVDLIGYPEEPAGKQTAAFNECLSAVTGRSRTHWNEPSDHPLGPVHINCAFDVPLVPDDEIAQVLPRWAETLVDLTPSPLPVRETAGGWVVGEKLPPQSYKTVVIAGANAGDIAQKFAQKLGLPLLAEPSSGARFSPNAVRAYPQVVAGHLGAQIEKVVLFGHPTLTRPITALLANSAVEVARYEAQPASWHEGNRRERVVADFASLAEFAGNGHQVATSSGEPWLNAWVSAGSDAARVALGEVEIYRATGEPSGRAQAHAVVLDAWNNAVEQGEVLVVGSSNLIRDLDFIAPALVVSPTVYANRGLAGIDGTIATATGISLAPLAEGKPAQPVHLILGDITFLHDASSLNIGMLEHKPKLRITVFNDHGGGIFSTLEHGALAQKPQFTRAVERYFTTPVDVDLKQLARAYRSSGIEVTVVDAA
ncbi:2-succinyl-5-enolpyruvyl-6-hydroxy-3-cyclohexene-1-carboxylic-acid synthase [Rothia sp. ZJ932]|uniref:2-succinyl-5-enolpyruvyl-6-hydroxy-3- cyclohexene-1-carboxylic-acid synthase n=1 Tax=Rothia sp. ZJ932 TaxID=2810516 RepID=UPI0019689CD0|nr:2-succinyl-5-enolpyruvyl-6-hydroxy-3-cyclohexene-1-carboxylic-acid synthase [Rothia sp. ZJ932]QRZ62006.1 2-succinyl-5-enolpyruvyl-6-hydroxy-3-cyclohexene-1-carboxylic-acid synthase [Rothia sp. ZJ932]